MTLDEPSFLFTEYDGTKGSYYTSFYKSSRIQDVGGKVPKIIQMTRDSEQRPFLYSVGTMELHFLLVFRHYYNKHDQR